MTEEPKDPFAHTRMSLGDHLDELRSRLFKGVLAVFVAFVVAWIFQDEITVAVTRPFDQAMDMLEGWFVAEANEILAADPERPRTDFFVTADPADERLREFKKELSWIKPGEGFFFVLKICLYAAIVVGAPVLLWQMWQFIAAGLYVKERRAVLGYFPVSVLAFAVGVLFGYFVMVPYGMYFLNRSVSIEIGTPTITVEHFLTFLVSLCLAFGAVFQLPLIMTFLARMGLVEPRTFSRYRGHFVIGAFVLAAMLTPPDPFTQLMLAIPLVLLFELGLISARVAARRRGAGAVALREGEA